MKKKDVSYEDKLNELMMDISHPNNKGKIFIFVEGESDIRLFRKFFDSQNCKVESIPGGNLKLEACIAKLIQKYRLIFAIRDADFLHLSHSSYEKENIFLTDYHDIEMTIISQDEVFSNLMFEYTQIPKSEHLSVRKIIIKLLEEISYFKWLNEIQNLEVNFKTFGFDSLFSFSDLNTNFLEYFQRCLRKNQSTKITDFDFLCNEIDKLKALNPNQFHLCNGHDFISVLFFYLRNKGDKRNINYNSIEDAFRMLFSIDLFAGTILYKNIKLWEEINDCSVFA